MYFFWVYEVAEKYEPAEANKKERETQQVGDEAANKICSFLFATREFSREFYFVHMVP